MKVYLWQYTSKLITNANPHRRAVKHFIFIGEEISDKTFDFLTQEARLVDVRNDVGWKVWELEL